MINKTFSANLSSQLFGKAEQPLLTTQASLTVGYTGCCFTHG